MHRLLVLSLAICTIGCTPHADHAAVMDNIEHAVRLPAGALPLDRYARAYAKGVGSHILAVYFLPPEPDRARCDTALAHATQNGQVALSCAPPKGMAANTRRWFETPAALPRAKVGKRGGCARIDLRFNVDTHRVDTVACDADPAPIAADLRS